MRKCSILRDTSERRVVSSVKLRKVVMLIAIMFAQPVVALMC
jgi:hypothetical protein